MTVTPIEPVQRQGLAQSNRRQPAVSETGGSFEHLVNGPETPLPTEAMPDASIKVDEEDDLEEIADDPELAGEIAPIPMVDVKKPLPAVAAGADDVASPTAAPMSQSTPLQTAPKGVVLDVDNPPEDPGDSTPAGPPFQLDVAPVSPVEPSPENVETETLAEIVVHQGRDVRVETRLPAAVNIPHFSAPHEVARQIADAVRSADDTRFEITLTPEELGKVRLVIVPGDKPSVAVYADNSGTLDLLRRNADMLQRELQDAGLGGAALSFGDGTRQDNRQDPARINGHEAGLLPTDDTSRNIRPARAVSLRQLDIRI